MKLLQFILTKSFLKLLLVFSVIVLVLLGGMYIYLYVYTGHGKTIEVPQVEGMTVDEAGIVFGDAGLEFYVIDSVYAQEGVGGAIVEQSPLAGKFVKKGRKIYLTVYRSDAPKEIIDVEEGESMKVAAIRLRNKGIDFDVEYEPNVLLDGRVIRILHLGKEIEKGDGLKRGAKVTLVVGERGNEEVLVPDLYGMTIDSAKMLLINRSLTVGYPFYDAEILSSEDSASARIYKQSPINSDEETVRVGSPIDIWLTTKTLINKVDSTRKTVEKP